MEGCDLQNPMELRGRDRKVLSSRIAFMVGRSLVTAGKEGWDYFWDEKPGPMMMCWERPPNVSIRERKPAGTEERCKGRCFWGRKFGSLVQDSQAVRMVKLGKGSAWHEEDGARKPKVYLRCYSDTTYIQISPVLLIFVKGKSLQTSLDTSTRSKGSRIRVSTRPT